MIANDKFKIKIIELQRPNIIYKMLQMKQKMKNDIQIEKNTPPIKNKRNQHNHKHQIIK